MLLRTNLTLRPVLNQFFANLQCVAVIQRTVGKQKTCDTFVRLQVGENVQNPGIVCIAFWWSFIVCPTAVVFQVLIIPAFQIEGRICHYVVKIQALVQVICKCRCRAVSRATLSWGRCIDDCRPPGFHTKGVCTVCKGCILKKCLDNIFHHSTNSNKFTSAISILPQSLSPTMPQAERNFPYSPKTFSFWYKNIIPTTQKHSPDSPKRFSFWYKNIIPTVQKDSPFSLRLCFCQPPS